MPGPIEFAAYRFHRVIHRELIALLHRPCFWSVVVEIVMPHVAFVPLSGMRVREEELLALGMSLPGLQPRARAIGQLPALGLLTLAA